VAEISLYYTSGGSDKEYHLQLIGTPGSSDWQVPFQYGRRGSASNGGFKIRDTTESKARSTYEKFIKEKVGKGYTLDYSGEPGLTTIEEAIMAAYGNEAVATANNVQPTTHRQRRAITTTPVPPSKPEFEETAPRRIMWAGRRRSLQAEGGDAQTGTVDPLTETLLSQQPNPIDDPEPYLCDDAFGMQKKYDGKHVMVRTLNGRGQAFNKKGQPILIPQQVMTDVLACGRDLEIDGELIGLRYVVYDLLSLKGKNLRGESYQSRHSKLPRAFNEAGGFGGSVEVAPLIVGERDKQDLFQDLQDEHEEGVVFKRLGSTFVPGRPSSGGDFLKHKFYATASCIVTAGRDGKRSVGLTLLDGRAGVGPSVIPVGNVTIPNTKVNGQLIPVPEENSIIEVRYLYAYRGGSLYQPVYLGPRDDVSAEECQISQLKYKPEA